MTHALPITFAFYSCTRGHHGRKTDWRLTLNHWDKQVPLALFGERLCHLKVAPGDESLAAEMTADLRARGFHVIQTVGTWTRGLSMGEAYMADCLTVSKDARLYTQPYYLHVEDDSPVESIGVSLEDLLLQSCRMLAENHELLTVRVARRGDARGPTVEHPRPDPRYFWSQDVNLQPLLMRSATFYQLGLLLERHPEACQKIQCEQLWRVLLDTMTRSPFRHLVWETSWAHSVHLGIPQVEHEAALRQLNLAPLTP